MAGNVRSLRNVLGGLLALATVSGCQSELVEVGRQTYLPSTLRVVAGDGQVAAVNGTLPQSLVVRATDPTGQGVPNALIRWTVIGGGRVTPAQSTTDASGLAATTFALGSTVGSYSVKASLLVNDAEVSSVTFTAQALPGAAAAVSIVSGDLQQDTVTKTLKEPLVVVVTDAQGNVVPGATVNWTVIAGGGSVRPISSVTDATGRAQTTLTLGQTVTTNLVNAEVTGASSVVFLATAKPGAPKRLAVESGFQQTGAIGVQLPEPLVARLFDGFGNPISGALINFSENGGGTITQTAQTDVDGRAQAFWTLGLTLAVNPHRATATVQGTTVNGERPFNAIPTLDGAPADLQPQSVLNPTGTANTKLSDPLIVRVSYGPGSNSPPVPGVRVFWEIDPGNGSLVVANTVTDANGLATAQWILPDAGTVPTVRASIRDSAGNIIKQVTFTATVL